MNPPPAAEAAAAAPPTSAPPPHVSAAAPSRAPRAASAARSRCSARPSSPPSPTSTPATSPPTSPAAPSTATCCVWVIVAANLMAMLVQYLSAKTGIATGRNLPELCREHFPRPVTWGLWVQAEAIAIATDLAEFVGAAIALNLLFGVPPFAAGLITAVVAFAILALQTRGYRALRARDRRPARDRLPRLPLRPRCRSASTARAFAGGLVPQLRRHRQRPARRRHPRRDGDAARRLPALRAHAARGSRRRTTTSGASCCASSALDVVIAMGLAGVINLTMLVVAAAALPRHRAHRRGLDRGRARRASRRCSAAARRSPSRSRCWPPACRARASAPSPARS